MNVLKLWSHLSWEELSGFFQHWTGWKMWLLISTRILILSLPFHHDYGHFRSAFFSFHQPQRLFLYSYKCQLVVCSNFRYVTYRFVCTYTLLAFIYCDVSTESSETSNSTQGLHWSNSCVVWKFRPCTLWINNSVNGVVRLDRFKLQQYKVQLTVFSPIMTLHYQWTAITKRSRYTSNSYGNLSNIVFRYYIQLAASFT